MEVTGRWHWVRVAAMIAAPAGVLLLLALVLDDFRLASVPDAVVTVIVISFVIGFVWPWACRLAARFHPLVFPLVKLFTVGFVVETTAEILPGVALDSNWASRHWRPLSATLGPDAGSDHLPVVATLRLRTNAI